MSPKPISIAFVSGKGGVGKTMLAANFAWVCARIAKTVLVDLDFQNQGCTGLFAPHLNFSENNALDAIKNPINYPSKELNQVAEGLYFFPAVSWQQRPSQKEISSYVNTDDFSQKLEALIRQLRQKQTFEIVVLDCHGGVEPVSWSAFQSCDYTLMVTEADSVTFAGTLELLNYYETKTGKTNHNTTSGEPPVLPQPEVSDTDSVNSSPCVKFIVNRLPSKYKWADLEQIYQRYLSKKLGVFTSDRSVFCYIPFEELLAESFGEYPFHVKLVPKSAFSKKIHFMAYSLLNTRYDLTSHYKPLRKFQSSRYAKKVERTVVSYEHKSMSSILKFFVWSSALYMIILIAYGLSILFGIYNISLPENTDTLFFAFFLIVFAPSLWYITKASLGLRRLYKEKHKFQKRLFQAVSPKLTPWQRLTVLKLLILRIVTTMAAYTIILGVILNIIVITILPFLFLFVAL